MPFRGHYPLTPRQVQVKDLLAEGKTIKEIAAILGIAYTTALTHVRAVRWTEVNKVKR